MSAELWVLVHGRKWYLDSIELDRDVHPTASHLRNEFGPDVIQNSCSKGVDLLVRAVSIEFGVKDHQRRTSLVSAEPHREDPFTDISGMIVESRLHPLSPLCKESPPMPTCVPIPVHVVAVSDRGADQSLAEPGWLANLRPDEDRPDCADDV